MMLRQTTDFFDTVVLLFPIGSFQKWCAAGSLETLMLMAVFFLVPPSLFHLLSSASSTLLFPTLPSEGS